MYNKDLNNLEMKLNNENDIFYIEKLNEFINESSCKTSIIEVNNAKITETKKVQKGCWEWFCGLFGCYQKEDNIESQNFVGLINIGNNCYLNAGLQILSRCYPLLIELLKSNYEKDKLMKLLVESLTTLLFSKDKYYNPSKFVEYFCKRNKEFKEGQQNCSQDFIRTILRNINETFEKNITYEYYIPSDPVEKNAYNTFIVENNIFPETKAYSIFSGMLKIHINGICSNCNTEINNYSFSSFVDQMIYLDSFTSRCKFSDILRKNIGKQNKASMRCPYCKEKIVSKSVSKFVRIPDIFIFTLERFLVRNKVPVEPDEFINIYDLVDESLNIDKSQCNYELFAVNIRLGNDISFGHEICHIKDKNEWYTINDKESHVKNHEYSENSYGLFYRRIKN